MICECRRRAAPNGYERAPVAHPFKLSLANLLKAALFVKFDDDEWALRKRQEQ
jgi:hypothetical protein